MYKENDLHEKITNIVEKAIDDNINIEHIAICLITIASTIVISSFEDSMIAESEFAQMCQSTWQCIKEELKNEQEKESIIDKVEEILKES